MGGQLSDVAWPWQTSRLRIRRAVPGDAEATWRFRRLPEVFEWITSGSSDAGDYHERFRSPDRLPLTLIIELPEPVEPRVIGDLMLRVEDAWSQAEVRPLAEATQAELGWTLDPAYGGRGYATEAVKAAIDISFGPLGLRRVVAKCFADNTASWRLMERVGMRREAHAVRDGLHRDGTWRDGYTYALLREEWPLASGDDQ